MQEEYWGVGRNGVDLVERGQPLFDELIGGEAADDPDPLRRRRAVHLRLEHGHGIRERVNAVPSQLHVVVEPAADHMHVAVDQARDDAPAIEIDAPRFRSSKNDDLAFLAYSLETSVPDRDRARLRVRAVERGDLTID